MKFLLPLLFISTALFSNAQKKKSQQSIKFEPPVLMTDKKDNLPSLRNYGRDTIEISLDSNDRILFYFPNPDVRKSLAEIISRELPLTEIQREEFEKLKEFGCALSDLPAYLDLGEAGRKKLFADTLYKGITIYELRKWLDISEKALTKQSVRKMMHSSNEDDRDDDFYPFYILKPGIHTKIGTFRTVNSTVISFYNGRRNTPKEYIVSKSGIFSKTYDEPGFKQHDFNMQGEKEIIFPPKPVRPVITIEEYAIFPGGNAKLNQYILENLVVPEKVVSGEVSGKVYVKFVVLESGQVSEVSVAKKLSGCPECDKEAYTLVKNMPNWVPGKSKGKAIASYFTLPVNFTIE